MTTGQTVGIGAMRRRAAHFLRRYAFGVFAVTVLLCAIAWQAWERPRRVDLISYYSLKPIPLATAPVTLHVAGMTVREVVEDLGAQCRVPVDYQENTLVNAGIDPKSQFSLFEPEVRVNVPAGQVSLLTALTVVRSISPESLDFDIEPERIVFSTREEVHSPKRAMRVVYPVSDLIGARSPFEQPDGREIVDLVRKGVQVENWRANGGTGAEITIERGNLIVDAPPSAHYMIRQLLELMRKRQ